MNFKAGDVVRLKSGGPDMTITSIATEDYMLESKGDVSCQWFDDKRVLQSATFKPEVLIDKNEADAGIVQFVNRDRGSRY